ncbi:MAG TPA: MerR family transcriptional regulator [Anaerolineales bacterium]|nr:MerR family transcriptional regulator [Anaerolineales bacterium]HNN13706.1 MerR family transcriptional regulator [Anaerolineales bacterium]HNO31107.1 MerR family transcriptional regulator [Anaerolineales bacterium]
MFSKTPAYNLKVVLRETGLAADTLRAWERRYGLPVPQRTAGGHRLYSQYDIETIKWLMARQEEGLSISRAVDLWNEMNASGSDPLAGLPQASLAVLQNPSPIHPADTTLDAIRAEWIAACLNFSETQAEQALNKAFSMFAVEAVCMDVLQKGMSEMGSRWYENRASVQQEHFASGLAMRRLDALLSASPTPTRNQTILVGCPTHEWHTFTPLLLSLLLRRRGLNVIYLGANVPAERFAETALKVKANLVILVCQTLSSAAHLQHVAFSLASQDITVGFGGRIFNIRKGIVDHIPGQFLGNTLDGAVQEVETLLKSKPKFKAARSATQEHLSAMQGFNAKRTHIESTLKMYIPPLSISPEELNTSIQYLGDNISAALQFGDMEHLSEEMEWVKSLLQSYDRPRQELVNFMEGYSQAVDSHINGQGDPIKKWLRAYATAGT